MILVVRAWVPCQSFVCFFDGSFHVKSLFRKVRGGYTLKLYFAYCITKEKQPKLSKGDIQCHPLNI